MRDERLAVAQEVSLGVADALYNVADRKGVGPANRKA